MTNNEAIARLQAAADIAITTGCELAKMPTMDALAIADLLKEQTEPEIIRCKDCEHYDTITGICNKGITHGYADAWYCADGERRVTQE